MAGSGRATLATRGPVTVSFGAPLRLRGEDYAALAKQVEEAVRGGGDRGGLGTWGWLPTYGFGFGFGSGLL
jgi:hypothetical protein